LDGNQGKFYDEETYGFNPNVEFMDRIPHKWEAFTPEDLIYMDDVKQRMFYNTLGDVVGHYQLQQLSQGLMGERMKRFLICVGKTNTGKGILCNALQLACGGYVGSFNAENLTYRNTSDDEAQLLSWAILLQF
jgi:hypothetical protein